MDQPMEPSLLGWLLVGWAVCYLAYVVVFVVWLFIDRPVPPWRKRGAKQ